MVEFWLVKLVNLCLSVIFLFGAWAAKRIVGVWLNPASIFLLFWFFYTALPLLLAFEAPVNPFAILYILSFGVAFTLPFSTFRWASAFKCNSRKKSSYNYFNKSIVNIAFYSCACLSVVMLLIAVVQQGFSVEEILLSTSSVGGSYADKRYASELTPSVISQLGLQISYYTVMLGGLIYGACHPNQWKKKQIILILAFAPAILVLLLQSAKGLFFFSIFLFVGGIFVNKIYNQNYILIDYATIRKLLMLFLMAAPIVVMSFVSRGYSEESDISITLYFLAKSFISYSSAHLPAFSDWFSERYFEKSLFVYKQESAQLGFYTFMSFFRLFGDERVIPMGIYDEFFMHGEMIQGNIYTAFRGLISDFGILGALLLAILAGWISAKSYWKLLVARASPFSITFFILFIAIAYQSFAISSLTWLTIPVVFLVQWLMLALLLKVRR